MASVPEALVPSEDTLVKHDIPCGDANGDGEDDAKPVEEVTDQPVKDDVTGDEKEEDKKEDKKEEVDETKGDDEKAKKAGHHEEVHKTLLEAEQELTTDFLAKVDLAQLEKFRKATQEEQSHHSYLIAFRALIGETAHHIKNGPNGANWIADTVQLVWQSKQKKLSGVAYRKLSSVQKYMYDEERKARDRRGKVVRRAQEAYEEGSFKGLAVAGSKHDRLPGAGRPQKMTEVGEALCADFIHYYSDLRGRVPPALLRGRCIYLIEKYKESGGTEDLPSDWQQQWLSEYLRDWRLVIRLKQDSQCYAQIM